MTLLSAISFFDEKRNEMGYIIASDSRAGVIDSSIEESSRDISGIIEKAFWGRNFIGIYAGGILAKDAEEFSYCQEYAKSYLAKVFSDSGKDFNHQIQERLFFPIHTLIAKRTKGDVELYQMRKNDKKQENWEIKKLHSSSKNAFSNRNSFGWFGPLEGEFSQQNLEEHFSPVEAQEYLLTIFNEKFMRSLFKYGNRKPFLYFVSPTEQGRIENSSLKTR